MNNRFKELLELDQTHEMDIERKALFYIIAGNDDLYSKADFIYDFKDKSIIPDCLNSDKVDFCSSSKSLIKLGFNLFNGYPTDVLKTFYILDNSNFKLGLNAIKIRFNK